MNLSFLPEDVVFHILSYNDRIKYRNGKYMNQISNDDKRYKLLLTIPPIMVNRYYEHVYEMVYCYDICYRPIYTSLCVDLEHGNVIYTFCYNVLEDPDNYHVWVRS
jgi:hypothetical protein